MKPLDVVVLEHDIPARGLRRGDLGAIVEVYSPDAFEVEFVSASGHTRAVVTLKASDIRAANDRDQLSVRPVA